MIKFFQGHPPGKIMKRRLLSQSKHILWKIPAADPDSGDESDICEIVAGAPALAHPLPPRNLRSKKSRKFTSFLGCSVPVVATVQVKAKKWVTFGSFFHNRFRSLRANVHLLTLNTMARAKGNEPAVPAHEEEREMLRPRKLALSRERVVTINKMKAGEEAAASPKVKVVDNASLKCLVRARMAEHPKVFLAKANGTRIQCLYCKKMLAPKKRNIEEHLKTVMHIDAIATMTVEGENLIKTVDYFRKYFDKVHAVGETLDSETLAFRINNMEMMLLAGSPIEKLDAMRPTLEMHGKLKLTSSSNMRRLIPPMLQREKDCIIIECKDKDIAVIFDGTSYTTSLTSLTLSFQTSHFTID